MTTVTKQVTIIGAGLAGSEAAYYLASRGIKTTLVDMKPKKFITIIIVAKPWCILFYSIFSAYFFSII